MHILSQWNPPSGAMEMATLTSALVLLCKMRCIFFFTAYFCLCALSERSIDPFFPSLLVLFCGGPILFLFISLVRQPLISFLNTQ